MAPFGDFWGTFGAAGFADFFAATGTGHAVLFGDTAGNEGGLFQVGIPALAGETYELNLSAAFEAEWDADTQFGLEFFEGDDATLVGASLEPLNEVPGAGYVAYSMSAQAPAGAERVRPIVVFSNAASTGPDRAATIDDLSVSVADEPCRADTNGDGIVSPSDFNAWILAFNNQAPQCDQNGDGLCTPADFNAWILNFNAGC
jgi:hypothetical protein